VEEAFPFGRGGRLGVPDARVIGDLLPIAWGPGPSFAQRLDAEDPGASAAGFIEGKHQIRRDVLHYARLQLPRMISGIVEVLLARQHRPPIHDAQKHADAGLHFTNHRFEIVAAMTIDENELADVMGIQALGNVLQDLRLRAGVHVHG
jgi:hypothetical protein